MACQGKKWCYRRSNLRSPRTEEKQLCGFHTEIVQAGQSALRRAWMPRRNRRARPVSCRRSKLEMEGTVVNLMLELHFTRWWAHPFVPMEYVLAVGSMLLDISIPGGDSAGCQSGLGGRSGSNLHTFQKRPRDGSSHRPSLKALHTCSVRICEVLILDVLCRVAVPPTAKSSGCIRGSAGKRAGRIAGRLQFDKSLCHH